MYRQLPHDSKVDHIGVLQAGKDQRLTICGYQGCPWKRSIYFVFTVLTVGILPLISRWRPLWHVAMTCSPCSLSVADLIVIKDDHDRLEVAQVILLPAEGVLPACFRYCQLSSSDLPSQEGNLRFFTHQHVRYIWNTEEERFCSVRGLDHGLSCLDLLSQYTGYSATEQQERAFLYGPNTMDIQVLSYGALLIDEILNPFYVFQIASIALWILDEYYYYAFCILVISCISVAVSLYETKKQRLLLRDMVTHSSDATVSVVRPVADSENTEIVEVPSSSLVPGDVICIPPLGCTMTCDAVLTAGNCLVNESMLTGESVPEYKTPLLHQDEEFSPEQHKRHVLYSGTEVIQTRYFGGSRVTAVVIRTGFCTAKGELVRSILFPQPLGFKFYKDAMKFVLVMFALASLGMVYTLYIYVERHVSVRETIVRALDIVTIVVPPALPAAMTVGTVYAQSRLKRKGIFCISPARINVGGKLKLICFDKTGTLTEEGLDLWGVLPVHNGLYVLTAIHATSE